LYPVMCLNSWLIYDYHFDEVITKIPGSGQKARLDVDGRKHERNVRPNPIEDQM